GIGNEAHLGGDIHQEETRSAVLRFRLYGRKVGPLLASCPAKGEQSERANSRQSFSQSGGVHLQRDPRERSTHRSHRRRSQPQASGNRVRLAALRREQRATRHHIAIALTCRESTPGWRSVGQNPVCPPSFRMRILFRPFQPKFPEIHKISDVPCALL